jgi:CHAD domain-containing protein
VLGALLCFRDRALRWPLRERGTALVEPGLLRVYGQGRRRFYAAAGARKRDRVLLMHEWRKRVKDLRYEAEILRRGEAPAALATISSAAPGGRRRRRRRERFEREAARMRRIAKRADTLGEALGEDHDLALLAETIRCAGRRGSARGSRLPALPKRTRKALLAEIRRRRRRLRRESLKLGAKLYAPGPRRFVRRIRHAYAAPAP